MAELHLIGEVLGASHFSKSNLFCSWSIIKGHNWTHVEGLEHGQTQVDRGSSDNLTIWAHPIDVHYSTTTVVGWPKLAVQVWFQDSWGRTDFAGYGIINIPAGSGFHDLEIRTWKPLGSVKDRFIEAVVGGAMQVKDPSLIWSGEDRRHLRTISEGKVHLRVNVLLRNFSKHAVKTS